MARLRQTVLHAQPVPAGGTRHAVHEGVLGGDGIGRGGRAHEPILLVRCHTAVFEVAGNGIPEARVNGDVAGHRVPPAIGAVRVDPAGVRDQRQSQPALKGPQSPREERRSGRIGILSAPSVPPIGGRAFGIPPAVELHVPERQTDVPELVAHRQERARIAPGGVVVVVIGRAVVGPVAQVAQAHVGIVRGPGLAP